MMAGFATADITCPPGTPLGGNARADKAARGSHDPLLATIAVFADPYRAGFTVVIGCDLLAAPAELVSRFTLEIARETGISADRVVVAATHTHSGPDVLRGLGFENHDFTLVDEWLAGACVVVAHAVALAASRVAPVSVTVRNALVPGVAFNRRLASSTGETRMNWEGTDPDLIERTLGPTDERLLMLEFVGSDGKPCGAIVHFTLHPAVLVGYDWLVSADWVGAMAHELSERGGGMPVLTLNGALGNINHLDYRQSGRAIGFAESDRIGHRVAAGARDGIAEPEIADAGIVLDRFTVTVPQRTLGADELDRATGLIEANAGASVDALDGIPPVAYAHWALTRGVLLQEYLDVPVTVVTIGPVTFVFLPFEVFVEFGLWLSAEFPDRTIRVVSLATDYLGYLPTRAAFAEGGYEPTLGTSTIAAGAGETLFEGIRDRLT